jgi:excinuclease ABC subunit C
MSVKYLLKEISKKNILSSPRLPGVYIYWNADKVPVYVGKAKNLKNRLYSYQNINLENKTRRLMEEAKYYSTINVASELEALLLEAHLVRKYKPKYNIQLKDDKHPLYIKITNDPYPIIITVRKIETYGKAKNIYGPFPSSQNVNFVLKFIRKLIPYADHLPAKKACIYSQIGLCDPCPSMIESSETSERPILRKKYVENINIIKHILEGKTTDLINNLYRRMKYESEIQHFEDARKFKEIIEKLNYIAQPKNDVDSFLENPNFLEDIREKEINELKKVLEPYLDIKNMQRIECYDIAHLMGQNPTASMVTFIDGTEEKSLYRKFRINQKKGNSDVDSMREVAERRIRHLDDWGIPDLIIVDGGKTQLNVFKEIFEPVNIAVIGLAKRFETIVLKDKNNDYAEIKARGRSLNLLQRLRNEAHRFARVYHHNLIIRTLIGR